jgi:hypothetical protein
MSPFAAARAALDALWSAIDPDEPLFCECRGAWTCADCQLSAPVDASTAWPGAMPVAAR